MAGTVNTAKLVKLCALSVLAGVRVVLFAQPELKESPEIRAFLDGSARKFAKGDDEGALDDLNRAAALSPDDPGILFFRAKVCQHMNNVDGALADYGRTITLASKSAGASANQYLGQALMEHGSIEIEKHLAADALADFNRLVDLDPRNSRARLKRALANTALGNFNAAIIDLDLALTRSPGNAEAAVARVKLAEKLGAIGTIEVTEIGTILVEAKPSSIQQFINWVSDRSTRTTEAKLRIFVTGRVPQQVLDQVMQIARQAGVRKFEVDKDGVLEPRG